MPPSYLMVSYKRALGHLMDLAKCLRLSYLGSAGCRTNAASSSDPVRWLRRFNDHIDSAILRNADEHLQNCLTVDPSRLTVNLGKRVQGCLNILRSYGRSKGLVQDWKIEGSMRTSRSFADQP